MSEKQMWYFGCESKDLKGHYFFKEKMISYESRFSEIDQKVKQILFQNKIDGGFCPKTENYQEEGKAKLTHIAGLSILSFWDRSADGRGNSNSNFIKLGAHDFETVLSEAKENFPQIFSRIDFEIAEHK